MMQSYFCHFCRVRFMLSTSMDEPTCPYCDTQFVEEVAYVNQPPVNEEGQYEEEEEEEEDEDDEENNSDDESDKDEGNQILNDDDDDDDEQQWETEEDEDDGNSISTNSLGYGSPSLTSSSISFNSIPSSSSQLFETSTLSSPSLSRTRLQQQASSLSSTSHHSTTRLDRFFGIERLLDLIYQGYSDSESEYDNTPRTVMDRLAEIFSDPMETPQASHNDDLDHCIERLSRRTLLYDNAETKLECTICQEPFGTFTEILQMPCQHEYHTTCISQWLHVNATCPICRCPAIMERSDDLVPPPAFSLGSLRTGRTSYPSTTDNEVQGDNYNEDDDDDETQSDYYEMIDPPPLWPRSSSTASISRYRYTHQQQ
ncbi:hypothetical protein BC941DRAFT_422064 [Chlamydoabsidia padenii]|nr:hypothetical protein BC941DRAFT_422064 [Chlamydoabsidia padenii]